MELDYNTLESDVQPVSADINDDGMADMVTIHDGILLISSEGDLGNIGAACTGKAGRLSGNARKDRPEGMNARGINRDADNRINGTEDYPFAQLVISVKDEWGTEADNWTRCFMMGFRDDADTGTSPLLIGMYSPDANKATVILVRIGGSLIWRRDYEQISMFYNSFARFADFNTDGVTDLLISVGNIFQVLDGTNGNVLWQNDQVQGYYYNVLVGDFGTGPGIWAFFWTDSGYKIVLISASGVIERQFDSPADYSHMAVGDVDGDGKDEAVLGGKDQNIYVFETDSDSYVMLPLSSNGAFGLYDLNMDGRDDIVYSKYVFDPEGNYYEYLSAADLVTGQTLWAQGERAAGTPVFYDCGASGSKILSCPNRGEDHYGSAQLIDGATGTVEQVLKDVAFISDICTAGDFNRDGVTEFVLYGSLIGRGCSYADGSAGLCSDWETVWEKDELLGESGADVTEFNYDAGAMDIPGTYRVESYVVTENYQWIESGPVGFTVVAAALGASMSPLPETLIKTRESYSGSIKVFNSGESPEDGVEVVLFADNLQFASWTIGTIAPRSEEILSFTIPPSVEGRHTIEVFLEKNGTIISNIKSFYMSVSPGLEIDIRAPELHSGSRFEIPVVLINSCGVEAVVTIALSDDPEDNASFAIPPFEKAVHTFLRQDAGTFSADLVISGDIERSLPVQVPYGYQLELAVPEILPCPKGIIRVPVRVAQAGPASYSGSLIATLTPAGGDPILVELPVHVAPLEATDVIVSIPAIAVGQSNLKIEASGTSASASRNFVIYEGGVGTLEMDLPSLLGEGPARMPFVLHNDLDCAGVFDVSLVSNTSGTDPIAYEKIVVPPGGSYAGTLFPSFEEGEYPLSLFLNGIGIVSGNVSVIKNIDAAFSLEMKEQSGSAPLVTALVENTGYLPLDAGMAVFGDEVRVNEIHLEKGTQAVIDMEIDPDNFGGENGDVNAILYLPDGRHLERTLALPFAPAEVSVIPPRTSPLITPGQTGRIPFTCVNSGDLSSEVSIRMDFTDGETGRYETTAVIPGHSVSGANMDVSLAEDFPCGISNAHYSVVSKETGAEIAEGDFPLTVQGARVEVTSSTDGVAYYVGSTVTLNVAYALVPAGSPPITVTAVVASGEREFKESIMVSGEASRAYSFPVDETTEGVSVNVLLPTGRSIYINRFRVYPLSSGFSIHPERSVYEAGEIVNVSAVLPNPGSLKLEFRGQEAVVSGSGNSSHSFQTPEDAREDSYILDYEYMPDDTSLAPSNGSIAIDVRGVVATSGESALDRAVFHSGENVSGRVVIHSNRNLSGSLEYFLTYPDGSWIFLGKEEVSVTGETPLRRVFSFPFTSVKAGCHYLGFMLVGASKEIYTEGSLPFSSGQATLLSLSTDKAEYPEGTTPVEANISVGGNGTAELSIFLDGTLVNQQTLNLNGISNNAYSLGAVEPKEHSVKAVIIDEYGQESSAYCRFIYGSALPDLTGVISNAGRQDGVLTLACLVRNKGASTAPSFKITLYEGDPAQEGALIGNILAPSIDAGASAVLTYEWDVSGKSGPINIHAVIDSEKQVKEWDETNNSSIANIVITETPLITVTPEEGSCLNTEVIPSISVTPEEFTVSMTIDDELYEADTPVTGEGEHVLAVKAANLEGDSFTATRHFSIDLTAPSVEIVSPVEGETVEPGFVPVMTTSDPVNDHFAALLDGQPYVAETPISEAGRHELSVRASDDCGNESIEATRRFTVRENPTSPSLPSVVGDFAFFGCDLLSVNGSVKTYGISSPGGEQGFGGHIGSNGEIRVSGSNMIKGNATPGPGYTVKITGRTEQVEGATDSSGAALPCEAQSVSEWASYALSNNNNSQIPVNFMDKNGNMLINGSRTCSLPPGIYSVSSLTVNGSARLVAGGKVVIVCTGAVTVNGSCSVNRYGYPGDLVIVSASDGVVTLNGGPKANVQVYAPLSNIIVNGSVAGIGDLWGKTLTVNGSVVWNRINEE